MEFWLKGQSRQEEEPGAAENVPGEQGSHAACPEARCALPGPQSVHAVEPSSAENLPTLHASQPPFPAKDWNRPASQLEQSSIESWKMARLPLSLRYFPAGQGLQLEDSFLGAYSPN